LQLECVILSHKKPDPDPNYFKMLDFDRDPDKRIDNLQPHSAIFSGFSGIFVEEFPCIQHYKWYGKYFFYLIWRAKVEEN
jgi:hypothetical protein